LPEDRYSRIAWVQVVLASVLMLATLPGRTQGLGLVTEPLLRDLHLDRVNYANMNLWATLLGALACFPAGWSIERAGLRWTAAGLVVLLGLSVWQLSSVMAGSMVLFGWLLVTRALGQSALSVCSIVTVGRWFPKRAGLAMGIYSVLLSVWFAVAFGLVGYSVRMNGWRVAWGQIALALVLVVTPLVLALLREPAETRLKHCEAEAAGGGGGRGSESSPDFTFGEALRSGAFWLFAGAAAAFNLVASGLGLFNEAVLAERGFDQQTFHLFLAVTTLMSLGGQFLCGWLSRKYRYQTLTSLGLLVYAVGLAFIPMISRHWQLWLLASLLGIAGGMIIVIFFSVWSDLFGQRHLGRIQGAAQMLTVLSSGLGPLVFAKSAEVCHSYAPLLFALAGLALGFALVARRVGPPGRRRGD
jgi:MFS family permease